MNTRLSTIEKFGNIAPDFTWPSQSWFMTAYRLPDALTTHKDYNFVVPFLPGRPLVKTMYVNRYITHGLDLALNKIVETGLVSELKEFGGCFNIRASRGSNNLSAHAWGLAIDINMTGNGLGQVPSIHKGLVECFESSGFYWGGRYKRPDGMHFSMADFDKPGV